jgi:pilus assembly protein CpaC
MKPAALAFLVLLAAAPEPPAIRVSPGSQVVIQAPGLQRVAVGNPEIADFTVTEGRELLVLGRKRGQTSLTLWARGAEPTTRTVIVDDGRLSDLAAAIREKVSRTLTTEVVNGKLVVDGLLDSVGQYRRLRALVGDDPEVVVLARLDPRALPAVADEITLELRRNGIRTVKAAAYGGQIALEGSVADGEELKRAQLIADSIYRDRMR